MFPRKTSITKVKKKSIKKVIQKNIYPIFFPVAVIKYPDHVWRKVIHLCYKCCILSRGSKSGTQASSHVTSTDKREERMYAWVLVIFLSFKLT